ncbi:MAG: SDR family NAD(P)-dependent oxidoreductase [Micromonosporaceae bacterium]
MTAVLITGCSSGVGAAAARRFLRRGWPVYATARRVESLAELAGAGAVPMRLDLTDEASMSAAVRRVEADHGAVGVLVNAAGYGLQGAIETLDLAAARAQFEVNLFGALRLSQLVAPAMRARRRGRIVTVGAMGGHVTFPGTGVLHASKHALRAAGTALRLELAPFGVGVSLVEPGPIRTPFAAKANATLPVSCGDDAYDRFHAALVTRLESAYAPGAVDLVVGPDTVARAIERAACAPRPKARYPVGTMSRGVIALTRLLPDPLLHALIRWQFPTPRPLVP